MLNTHLTRPVNNTVLVVSPQVRAIIESLAQDNGRKRHIAVDAIGLLLAVLVTAAGVQDRDGAKPLLWNLRKAFPSVRLTWADSGYAGQLVTWAARLKPKLRLQIVKRTEQHRFVVLPRRWVVERTFSWILRSRRTVRDYERLPAHHETIVHWAMIIVMSRRLGRTRQSHPPRTA
ncbi:MAG: transposase [Streptosporangiaceae bacterium]